MPKYSVRGPSSVCPFGKQVKWVLPWCGKSAQKILELNHSAVWATSLPSLSGHDYYVSFIDYYYKKTSCLKFWTSLRNSRLRWKSNHERKLWSLEQREVVCMSHTSLTPISRFMESRRISHTNIALNKVEWITKLICVKHYISHLKAFGCICYACTYSWWNEKELGFNGG